MLRILVDPKRLLNFALLGFAVWFVPLLTLMVLENLHFGEAFFNSALATYTYLIVHGLLTAVALALGVLTLLRGPTTNRLIVILPVVILLLYGGMLIGGPG